MLLKLKGYVVSKETRSNGWSTFKVKTDKSNIFMGTSFPIQEGKYYEIDYKRVIKGSKIFNNVISFTEYTPTNEKEVISYFEDNVSGVGQKTAEKIFNHFGQSTLQFLTEDPQAIKKVKLKETIHNNVIHHFKNKNEDKAIIDGLKDLGITYTYAIMLISKLEDEKHNILDFVKDNPYILKQYIKDYDFEKCDYIAKQIGYPKTHPMRVSMGILEVLKYGEQQGHTYLPYNQFIEEVANFLEITITQIELTITDLKFMFGDEELEFENDNEYSTIYLKRNKMVENRITQYLKEVEDYNNKSYDIDNLISEFEQKEKIDFNKEQKQAIKMVFKHNVSILSGGPGTGKTTVLNAITYIANIKGLDFNLAAPTGKASSHMKEATGYNSSTIHKMLDSDLSTGELRFKYNHKNKLNKDLIILDECSMVDHFLFYDFIQAIQAGTRLLLVGDPEQLPSVGAGKVFEDLIESECFTHTHLSQIYRQGKESLIVENAYRINKRKPIIFNSLEYKDDFKFYEVEDNLIQEKVLSIVRLAYNKNPEEAYKNVQVLAPRKKGKLGTEELNLALRNILNPNNDLEYRGFRLGDKVIQSKNNNNLGIYNGDEGIISKININKKEITVKFDKQEITYSKDNISELQLSYALTIHKSQGSEYKMVIIPISIENEMMITKKLIYTAVTRAKNKLFMLGNSKVLNKMHYNPDPIRLTRLEQILRKAFDNKKQEDIELEELRKNLANVKFTWND